MMNSINERRSIRKYQEKEVDRALITELIQAARMAPSAKNRQPWKYLAYTGNAKAELLERMQAGLEREQNGDAVLPESAFGLPDAFHTLEVMREAPVLLVILNTNGTSPYEPIDTDHRVSEICDSLSIGASVQNILLRATELGLGTLWIANTCFAYPELVDYLDTGDQLVGAISVGYPAEHPPARPRKQIEDILEFRR
ncbi:MAG: nitroreductase family protein [Lachnospiraceae bacterium]|nr:nitroreductase family protein [Lachnospiraceae bacterium]